MIHRFQPSITATKDEALKPPKGFRFGNFEGVRALPSVGTAHIAGQHVNSYFNNKQIFYTICEWFETWMPWQRRIILCGTTDRCSNQQLECLATVLEPVFHRDFATALKGYYPRAPLKKPKKNCHMALMRALQMATEGTDLDPRRGLVSKRKETANKIQENREMQQFALKFVENILAVSVRQYLAEEESSKSSSYDELNIDDENNNMTVQNGKRRIVSFTGDNDLNEFSDGSHANTPELSAAQNSCKEEVIENNELVERETPSRTSNYEINTESRLSEQQSKLNCDETRTISASPDANHRPYSSELSLSLQLHHKTQYADLSEHRVYSITPTQSRLPPLEAKKASTLSWCMNRQLSASLPSTPVSGNSARLPHRHHSNVSSVNVTSTSEFFQKQKTSRLGSMHGALRTGRIKKPNQIQDLYIPVQKSFKNAKWWNSNRAAESDKNKSTTKPNKDGLKEHFKQQVLQVWQWLSEWEDHEKGDLLVELIKLCDQDLLKFFAQCLVQRLLTRYQGLEDRSDINSLPDKLLFYIFTFLTPEDIGMAEKVCRRWHYISAQDELWRIKCEELGVKENVPNLVTMVEDYMKDKAVDWKEAYEELSQITLNARVADQGRRHGWLRGSSRQCHLLKLNFDDLLKRTPVPIESLQNIPIVDSSSSSDESIPSRRMSTVVDVPIHFMQTAYDDDEDSETNADGLTPDMQGYNRRSTTRNEADQSSTPTQDKKRVPKPKKKKIAKAGQAADFAFDIRPDPTQAKDIMPDKTLEKNESEGLDEFLSKERDVVVKPVKRVRRLQGHMDAVFCLMFDARRIVTGSMDRTIRVWDIRSGRSIHKIYGHKGGIRCIQFDEDKIISGSWDTTIMVWDIIHFNRLAVLAGHNDVVSCLRFNQNYL
ncbi:uncharacterized protein [Amphiura filiformis]|uniref:uncharacterized protein n=1 Tax=Amphiura filiformis TaxID=82378 RepID=UPI003B20D03D